MDDQHDELPGFVRRAVKSHPLKLDSFTTYRHLYDVYDQPTVPMMCCMGCRQLVHANEPHECAAKGA